MSLIKIVFVRSSLHSNLDRTISVNFSIKNSLWKFTNSFPQIAFEYPILFIFLYSTLNWIVPMNYYRDTGSHFANNFLTYWIHPELFRNPTNPGSSADIGGSHMLTRS